MYVYTTFTHIIVYKHKYNCMYTQLKLLIKFYVYTIRITQINVCLQKTNDSEID